MCKRVPPKDAWALGGAAEEGGVLGPLLHGVGPLRGVNEDTAMMIPTGRRGVWQRGSCTEERRQLCAWCIRGERTEWGERPSEEKAATVQAGQLHQPPAPSPRRGAQEEAQAFLLCVCSRAKKKEAEVVGVGVGRRRTGEKKGV